MTADAEFYIGLMSGTSVDGIDCCLISIKGDKIELIASHAYPYTQSVQQDIKQLIQSGQTSLESLGKLSKAIAIDYADAVRALLKATDIKVTDVTAIGCHGQTVRHSPPNISAQLAFSMQLGDASTLAHLTGIDVIADFRQADMAVGGQGAPLAPGFHQHLFKQYAPCAVLNLGGIANISLLNSKELIAFDTGPASTLLDAWITHCKGKAFDDRGNWAKSGTSQPHLLNTLMNEPYFKQTAPKSTGFELFNMQWLNAKLDEVPGDYAPEDIQASLAELSAKTIANELNRQDIKAVYVCGGGVHNHDLMDRLQTHCNAKVVSTATIGLDPDYVEAMAFAWFAYCNVHNITANVPSVTGASKAVVLGGYYKH